MKLWECPCLLKCRGRITFPPWRCGEGRARVCTSIYVTSLCNHADTHVTTRKLRSRVFENNTFCDHPFPTLPLLFSPIFISSKIKNNKFIIPILHFFKLKFKKQKFEYKFVKYNSKNWNWNFSIKKILFGRSLAYPPGIIYRAINCANWSSPIDKRKRHFSSGIMKLVIPAKYNLFCDQFSNAS